MEPNYTKRLYYLVMAVAIYMVAWDVLKISGCAYLNYSLDKIFIQETTHKTVPSDAEHRSTKYKYD